MGQQKFPDVSDGRFVGASGRYWLILRVDVDKYAEPHKIGAVSGDIQSTGPEEGAGYASFRSAGNLSASDLAGPIDVVWTDATGQTSDGCVRLEPSYRGSDDGLRVRLETGEEIGGIGAGAGITIEAHPAGSALRELTVQLAYEVGVRPDRGDVATAGLAPFAHRLADWWRRAGFAVDTRRAPNKIDRPKNGWAESDIFAELQNAMDSSRPGPFDRPDWDVCLLVLSTTDRAGLEGVMFDIAGPRPRQGAAIFVDAIRAREPDPSLAERMVLKTAVHELGHALNLVHRFDPEVRRSSSSSAMTYDWLYPGGIKEFWRAYGDGSFDSDELTFLRHAPHSQVIPGGDPFGSAVYWEAGRLAAGGVATDPGEPWRSLSLWLTPPAAGTSFMYGQPIFVEVSLLNTGPTPIRLPQHVLDLKAGRLDILIKTVGSGARPGAAAKPFTPIMQRCFSVADAESVDLAYGESLHTNANLAYGSGGSDFADPGLYELTPVLSFPPDPADPAATEDVLDHLVVGPSLQIRVEAPQGRSERQDGEALLGRPDIGISLALGGSTSLPAAAGALAEMRERRVRQAAGGRPDPIAVTIARAAGIFEGRMGNFGRAAELLSHATTREASRYFDPHTAEHTRRLAETYEARTTGKPNRADPTMVVVDLWTTPRNGGPVSGGRASGLLITRGAPSGGSTNSSTGSPWGVLAPASQLPPDAMDGNQAVAAIVTLASGNGVTQRVAAGRIDLVPGADGAEPALALVELSHPVPGRSDGQAAAPNPSAVPPVSDVASFFGGLGSEVVRHSGKALDAWSEAADQGLADAPRPRNPLPPAPARVHRYPGISLNDVAGWHCWLLGFGCQEPPPPPDRDTPYPVPYPPKTSTYPAEPPPDYWPSQEQYPGQSAE